jgi:protein-tyrosine phosphatase
MTLPHAVELQGPSNVRDLGGWPVRGGRRVRTGRVLRSASLASLTEADAETLLRLGLRTIADLRGEREAEKLPTDLALLPGVAVRHLPIEPSLGASLRDILATREATGEDMLHLMKRAYRSYVADWSHRYRALFELAERADEGLLLFHCAAGKDRTGVGAALLLTALGADRGTVMEDYLATNRLWRGESELAARLTPAVADELLRVRSELLDEAFSEIEAQSGSVDAYFEHRLGFDAARLDRLRETLTE